MQGLDVAIYLRKSRADVEEEQKALANGLQYDTLGKHRQELLNVAKQNKHNVIDIYEELISGEYIASRPAMQEMLEQVELGKYEAVLVVDIDRLGRGNKMDQGRIENTFRESGTIIVTPNQLFDLTQEDGEFGVEVRTFLANMEYRSIKRRLQRGLINSVKQGKDMGGTPPYGYEKDKEYRLVIKEPEAQTVRDIFRWCIEGEGILAITNHLYSRNTPSPSGNPRWGITTIQKVIQNKKYAGYQIYGKNQQTKRQDGTYTPRKKRDDRKYVEVPESHEPIVPPELFELAQQCLSRRDPKLNEQKRLVYPLAGLLICKRCGRAMRCMVRYQKRIKYIYCSKAGCDVMGIRLDRVEDVIMNEMNAILARIEVSDDLSHVERLADEKKAISNELEQMIQETKKDEIRKGKVYESYEEGIYTKETFLERLQAIQSKQRERVERSEVLNQRINQIDQKTEEQKNIVPKLMNVLSIYNSSDAMDKNKLLKTIIRSIIYDRDPIKDRKRDKFELVIHLIE